MAKLVIQTEIATRKLEQQINDLEDKLEKLENNKIDLGTDLFEQQKEADKLATNIEKATKRMQELRNTQGFSKNKALQQQYVGLDAFISGSKIRQEELNNQIDKTNVKYNDVNKQITKVKNSLGIAADRQKVLTQQQKLDGYKDVSNSIQNMTSNMKRFALSLFSVRGLYSLLSKASSAYLSDNEDTAKKISSVWSALGSLVGPVIDMMANALLKLIGYLNVFVKAFTKGKVDFIANANARALEKQAKAQGKLNRQNYDFDVIRKQQSNSNGNSSSGSGLIEIPELKDSVVEKLEKFAKLLSDNWDLIKKVGKALLIAFGAKKLLDALSFLMGGAGLGGLLPLLAIFATAWIATMAIEGIMECIEQSKQLTEDLKGATEAASSATNGTKKLTEKFKEQYEAGKLNDEQIQAYIASMKSKITQDNRDIASLIDQSKNLVLTKKQRAELNKQIEEQIKSNFYLLNSYDELYNQGQLNDEQTQDYIKMLGEQILVMDDLGYNTDDLREKYEKLTGKKYDVKVESDVKDNVTPEVDKIIKNNSGRKITLGSILTDGPVGALKKYFGFATGGIVTQPTRALIGEAGYPEAVVPMNEEYLSTLAKAIGQYGGGSGGGTTNVYLDGRLIQRQVNNRSTQVGFARNS